MFDVSDKHILITGATSGLGEHFARMFAAKGARVTLTGRRKDRLELLVKELNAKGLRTASTSLDVTCKDSVVECFENAEKCFGPPDVVINNAGVSAQSHAEEFNLDDWNKILDTNLRGVWLVACQAAKSMIEQGKGGSIINIASILGLRVASGVAPYAISKAGVIQLTRQLALEWARHNIRVNSLAPGYFETELNRDFVLSEKGKSLIARVPMRRLGRPTELDGPILLLASDASKFMTGASIPVDGGHLVSSL